VVRVPAQPKDVRPPQHNPEHQRWVLDQYQLQGIPVPLALYCDNHDDFLIESCVEGKEVVHLAPHIVQSSYVEIGRHLKDMHKVRTKKFGHFGPEPGVGTDESWYAFLKHFFINRLNIIESSGTWDHELCERIRAVTAKLQNYFETFSHPCLVHGDMNTSNVFLDEVNGNWQVSGIIDFADALSGDPLFDLGGLLLEIHIYTQIEPLWSDLKEVLEGYGALTAQEEELVKFYALVLSVFYLCEDNEVRVKRIELYTAKVKALLAMMNA